MYIYVRKKETGAGEGQLEKTLYMFLVDLILISSLALSFLLHHWFEWTRVPSKLFFFFSCNIHSPFPARYICRLWVSSTRWSGMWPPRRFLPRQSLLIVLAAANFRSWQLQCRSVGKAVRLCRVRFLKQGVEYRCGVVRMAMEGWYSWNSGIEFFDGEREGIERERKGRNGGSRRGQVCFRSIHQQGRYLKVKKEENGRNFKTEENNNNNKEGTWKREKGNAKAEKK